MLYSTSTSSIAKHTKWYQLQKSLANKQPITWETQTLVNLPANTEPLTEEEENKIIEALVTWLNDKLSLGMAYKFTTNCSSPVGQEASNEVDFILFIGGTHACKLFEDGMKTGISGCLVEIQSLAPSDINAAEKRLESY